jgi:hypothetical protein
VEIGLFGSYANGNPSEQSDIDLLIKLKEPRFRYLQEPYPEPKGSGQQPASQQLIPISKGALPGSPKK